VIWWKEWRETRFGFLTTLFFMTGLYASMPMVRMSNEDYWIGVFLTFFGMAIAVVLGAGAFAPEVESETIAFVLSKPLGRAKYLTAKYIVRGGEALALVAVPLGFMTTLRDWEGHTGWMWCAPYLLAQDISFVLGIVVLTFSGAFFFSVLFRKQALSALAGITLLAAYLAWRGVGGFRKVYQFEPLEADILILVLLIAGIFFGSLFAFRVREF
jgi:ABC-type transport system involved in multi-copper enzyme maturation permease subunit